MPRCCKVALRKESVDRNAGALFGFVKPALSLSARRAWIEICWNTATSHFVPVALRKESVDRNSWPSHASPYFHQPVALRKESVDRNSEINTRGSEKVKSLSARRAWIEITQ